MSADRLISVVLPTYNRAALLGRAMRSVLAQTHRELELIVVDDASTDDTPALVAAFNDPRVRYLRQPGNRRAAAARNAGIRAARGALLAFQDDDDVWFVQKLERQRAALLQAAPTVGMNLCGFLRRYPGRVEYVGGPAAFARIDFDRTPPGGFGLVSTPGWLVRRETIERTDLFDERMRSWDDWELALRLRDVCDFSHLDEPLYLQDRVAGGAMWKDQGAFAADMRVVLARHEGRWLDRPGTRASHYALVGRFEARFGDLVEGRRWLWRALCLRPFRLRTLVAYAASLLGRRASRLAGRLAQSGRAPS